MSTKAIRELIKNVGHIDDFYRAELAEAALEELEAIEEAAGIMQHAEPPLWTMTQEQQDEAEKAQELMAAIARQEEKGR